MLGKLNYNKERKRQEKGGERNRELLLAKLFNVIDMDGEIPQLCKYKIAKEYINICLTRQTSFESHKNMLQHSFKKCEECR